MSVTATTAVEHVIQLDSLDNFLAHPSQRFDHTTLAAIDEIVAAAPLLASSCCENLSTLLDGVAA